MTNRGGLPVSVELDVRLREAASGRAYRSSDVTETTFYCTVADRHVFPGVVGLLNSLRLTGVCEPLRVLDAGLTAEQRRLLEDRCTVSRPPAGASGHPALLKPLVPPPGIEGTLVFLDSDLIVTDSPDRIVQMARRGSICAFADPEQGRRVDAWAEIFDLRADLRRETYVSSHLVAFSTIHWPDLLPRWAQACRRIRDRRVLTVGDPGSPVHAADQDALNALLMSEIPPGAVTLLPSDLRVQGPLEARMTSVIDPISLHCEHAGHRPAIIHIGGKRIPKPWQPAARSWVRRDAYTRLLRRLLHGRDVALPLSDRAGLPLWLAGGTRGAVALSALSALHAVRDRTGLARRARPFSGAVRRRLGNGRTPDHAR